MGFAASAGGTLDEAKALLGLGTVYRALGRSADAGAAYRAAAARFRRVRNHHGEAMSLANLANLELYDGNIDEALRVFPGVIDRFRSLGAERSAANSLTNYGTALARAQRLDEAVPVLQEASALGERVWAVAYGNAECSLARIHAERGRFAEAHAAIARSLAALAGTDRGKWLCSLYLRSALHSLSGSPEDARADFDEAEARWATSGLGEAKEVTTVRAAVLADPARALFLR